MIIIGEKINGTLESTRSAIGKRDADAIAAMALSQVEAGADYLDINVATIEGGRDYELDAMAWALEVVKGVTDKPVALDSSDPAVLQKGLELCDDPRTFINSVTGETGFLEGVLPLAARHGCHVVALAMDESGIPGTAEGRVSICRKILDRARGLGIPESNIYFDPLVLPVSTDCNQARLTLDTLAAIKSELPDCKSVLGLSNVSFGLPLRPKLNQAFLSMCVFLGLDAVLLDPSDVGLRTALFASLTIAGEDGFCSGYIKAYRRGMLG